MVRWAAVGTWLLGLVLSGHADDGITSVSQLSALEQQKDDFYGALARPREAPRVRWEWPSQPSFPNCDIQLSLIVQPVLNPAEVHAPVLSSQPDFEGLFVRMDPPEIIVDVAAQRVEFRYLVRPRKSGVLNIPELKFVYYVPSGQRFQTVYAAAISSNVADPPDGLPTSTVPLDGPPAFFQVRTDSPLSRSHSPTFWWWPVTLAIVGAATGVSIRVWHRLFPDAARQVRIRKLEAVRRTLTRLRHTGGSSDPARELAHILRGYLSARLGLHPRAQTPPEVAAGLAELDIDHSKQAQILQFLQDCDSSRFSGTDDSPVSVARLRQLIERWEGLTP